MNSYVLAIDQGTTSSRAILFDGQRRITAVAQKEIAQRYPREGWVEHDAMEIYSSTAAVMAECVAASGVDERQIAAIGITNQRETTILWDKRTGYPIGPAIVWQCRRTAPMIDELVKEGLGPHIKSTTGLIPDAYFSGPKIKWLLDTVPGAREAARRGDILFGTVDSWLIWKMTDGAVHATDHTNASRTMLYNIKTLDWDDRLLERLDIPRAMLPEVRDSNGEFGYADMGGAKIPIRAAVGDQQSALFGQNCLLPGEAKNTYGTGCFLLMNTGDCACTESEGLLATIAATRGGSVSYALEGSVFTGGSLIQWMRDQLGFFNESSQVEALASAVANSGGVYIVPAFTGLGAPYWDMYARGSIFGLTRGTNRSHLARAAVEAIAFQVSDVMHAVVSASGFPVSRLSADGGASRNSLLMQLQADISGVPVVRSPMSESTAYGAALLAGTGAGIWDPAGSGWTAGEQDVFHPSINDEERRRMVDGWHLAVKRTLSSRDD